MEVKILIRRLQAGGMIVTSCSEHISEMADLGESLGWDTADPSAPSPSWSMSVAVRHCFSRLLTVCQCVESTRCIVYVSPFVIGLPEFLFRSLRQMSAAAVRF